MRNRTRALVGLVLAFPCALAASEWDRFRGPNGAGVVDARAVPETFGPDRNVVWSTEVPPGHSSPVLGDERIFLTAFEDDRLLTMALDRVDGRMLWRRALEAPRAETLDPRNNPASPSPAVDAKNNVYVFFGEFGLLSYDASGVERWRLPLGPFNNIYGMGASPIVAGGLVILVCDQQRDSFIVAVDATSGEERWRVARPEAKSGHATPILYRPADGPLQVLVVGSFLLTSYDATTGERLWWVGGLPFEMKSTPVINDGILYVHGFATPFNQPGELIDVVPWAQAVSAHDTDGNGFISPQEFPEDRTRAFIPFVDIDEDGQLSEADWGYYRAAMASVNGLVAIRLGGSGDMTDESIVWRYHRSVPQLPSPLLYGGVLFIINDGGIATSFRATTGEVVARGRLRGAVDSYYASPVAADGKVFFVSESGKVVVVRSGGQFDVIAVNDLGVSAYATPAIADGRIYVRTTAALWAFGRE